MNGKAVLSKKPMCSRKCLTTNRRPVANALRSSRDEVSIPYKLQTTQIHTTHTFYLIYL